MQVSWGRVLKDKGSALGMEDSLHQLYYLAYLFFFFPFNLTLFSDHMFYSFGKNWQQITKYNKVVF